MTFYFKVLKVTGMSRMFLSTFGLRILVSHEDNTAWLVCFLDNLGT